ncbi:hypothetical protein GCM10027402_02300 [Arthrobacter monumenti]
MSALPLVTAAAALLYGSIAAVGLLTGNELPLGNADAPPGYNPLNGPLGDVLHYALPSLAMIGALIAAGVHRVRRPGKAFVYGSVGFAAVYSALILLLVADSRILTVLGYAPFLAVKAVTDPGSLQGMNLDWTVMLHQLVTLAGVGLWILTATAAARKASAACLSCGRRNDDGGWFTAEAARKWAAPVTIAAAVIPALYAFIRLAWFAGIPLGISTEFLATMQTNGMVYAGLGLAAMALLGSVLTLGLLLRWGSVFPRWLPMLGGHPVPVLLAVIPAGFVSVIVVPAGAEMIRLAFSSELGSIPFDWTNWGTVGPTALWILWGPLLGAATIAYYLKRRRTCSRCGLNG